MKRKPTVVGRWRIVIFVLIVAMVAMIWASTKAATNAVYHVPFVRETADHSNLLFITGDSLHADSMSVSIFQIVRALNKIAADSIEGSGSILGIGDNVIRFDVDSLGSTVTLTFGGYGGGLRWVRSSDKMQFTNDFSTWTDIGTGGSSSSIDEDSTFVTHFSSRWSPLPDSNRQYFGNASDSALLLLDTEEDLIVFYRPVYKFDESVADSEFITRGEAAGLTGSSSDSVFGNAYRGTDAVADSAFPTWNRVNSAISGAGGGDVTGVTAGNGLIGTSETGPTPVMNVNPGWGVRIDNDSTEVNWTHLKDSLASSSTAPTISGIWTLSGNWVNTANPWADNEVANNITVDEPGIASTIARDTELAHTMTSATHSAGNWKLFYSNGSGALVELALAASGFLKTNGAANAPTFADLTDSDIPDAITVTGMGDVTGVTAGNGLTGTSETGPAVTLNVAVGTSTGLGVNADSVFISAGGVGATQIASDAVTEAKLKAINTAVDEDILTYESTTGDFEWHTPSELGLLTSETGDISSVGVTAPVTGGGSSGAVTIGFDWTWLWTFIDTTAAKIPTATLADSSVKQDTANTLNWAETRQEIKNGAEIWNKIDTTSAKIPTASVADSAVKGDTAITVQWVEMRSEIKNGAENYNKIDTTTAKIPTATLADSTNGGAIRAETAKSVIANSVDSTEIINLGVGNEDLNTGSVTGAKILDGTVALGDLGANSVDSTKIADGGVGSADIGTGRITGTHLLDGTVATADILNQTVGQADIDSAAGISTGRIYNSKKIFSDSLASYNADSNLCVGNPNGLQIGQGAVTLLSGLTDDSLVVEWNPEYPNMVVMPGFSTVGKAYLDSMKIYGDVDTLQGNCIVFHDSTLTNGNHRRSILLEIPVPDRVDSLRRVIVECKSNTYSAGTTEMFTRAKLHTCSIRWSNVDSLSGGSVLDLDSSAAATITNLHLNGDWAATPFSSFYLLISARRDVGTAFLYSQIFKIRMVWSRTRL